MWQDIAFGLHSQKLCNWWDPGNYVHLPSGLLFLQCNAVGFPLLWKIKPLSCVCRLTHCCQRITMALLVQMNRFLSRHTSLGHIENYAKKIRFYKWQGLWNPDIKNSFYKTTWVQLQWPHLPCTFVWFLQILMQIY